MFHQVAADAGITFSSPAEKVYRLELFRAGVDRVAKYNEEYIQFLEKNNHPIPKYSMFAPNEFLFLTKEEQNA